MFENLAKAPAEWLSGDGHEASVVLSTRVRLARNIAGLKYPDTADSELRHKVVEYVESAVGKSDFLKKGSVYRTDEISDTDSHLLVERHLISPAMLHNLTGAAVYFTPDERISVMINEEDHLRIQSISTGLEMDKTMEVASQYDNELGRLLEFDYDSDFGFLTACPTNVGTGLRISVLIHLPGLVVTEEIDKVIKKISQKNLVVRGFYGEGSDVLGNLFQISNQSTLGQSEQDIMEDIDRVTRMIIEDEATARNRLRKEAFDEVADKIWRAYGILKYARVMSSEEVMNLLSAVRLGLAMGILDTLTVKQINDILLLSQPAHLMKITGEEMDSDQRDAVRAQMVREKLA